MPTVYRFGRWRVVIYLNDHRPAHVHVIGSGREAVLKLNCPAGPIVVRENYGCLRSDITRMKVELRRHLPELCMKWRSIHGHV